MAHATGTTGAWRVELQSLMVARLPLHPRRMLAQRST
jgi:hypothetical protein